MTETRDRTKGGTEMKTISADVVHNWSQQYAASEEYAGLRPIVHRKVLDAHIAHHKDGVSARDAARQLAADWPQDLEFAGW